MEFLCDLCNTKKSHKICMFHNICTDCNSDSDNCPYCKEIKIMIQNLEEQTIKITEIE